MAIWFEIIVEINTQDSTLTSNLEQSHAHRRILGLFREYSFTLTFLMCLYLNEYI